MQRAVRISMGSRWVAGIFVPRVHSRASSEKRVTVEAVADFHIASLSS